MTDPAGVVAVEPGNSNQFSFLNYRDLRDSHIFADVVGSRVTVLNLRSRDNVERVNGLAVTANFLANRVPASVAGASRSMFVVVRSERTTADVIAAVREEVARLDGGVPSADVVRLMQDVVAASPGVPARRVLTATFTGFALLAIVLAGIGLFGVVAHDVASRRAELALRIALGADPMRILVRTLGQGVWMVGAGLVLGGVLSVWVTRALGSMMFGTGPFDPLNIAVAAAVLMAVGAIAVLPAARRAARTDPVSALRSE